LENLTHFLTKGLLHLTIQITFNVQPLDLMGEWGDHKGAPTSNWKGCSSDMRNLCQRTWTTIFANLETVQEYCQTSEKAHLYGEPGKTQVL
jgi:hypothetical protein